MTDNSKQTFSQGDQIEDAVPRSDSASNTKVQPSDAERPSEENLDSQEVANKQRKLRSMTPLQGTVELVKRGHQEFLPRLREQLKGQPDVWNYVGDLARQTERVWVERIAGKDHLFKESLVLHAEAMRADLAGPEPSPLEKLIVERIVAIQLQLLYFDAVEAQSDLIQGGKAAEYLMQRQQQAHKQLLQAAKTLEAIRRIRPQAIIEIPQQAETRSVPPTQAPLPSSSPAEKAVVNGHGQNGSHTNGYKNRINGYELTEVAGSP